MKLWNNIIIVAIEHLPNLHADSLSFSCLLFITMEFDFNNLEPLLATLTNLFANAGSAKQVAVLVEATAKIVQIDYDNWNGGTEIYNFYLTIPDYLVSQIANDQENLENEILEKTCYVLRPYMTNWYIKCVVISPTLSSNSQWREKAKAWIGGQGITNQGRVRSDNIANKSCDGLLFRSQPEIYLYQAFKALGVSFAPLPVFIRGGKDYRRIEPDFVIIKDGLIMIIEVDGDSVHRETPAEAHTRLTMLTHEGAISERVLASECSTPENAKKCASQLLEILNKRRKA
ncbi:hypothetical protein [Nostoc sp. 'Lobaria pulmonaria (5183) cyanobiont']|uniref:hypothetical protein n=1 Tax=Nostoc sp. 'Lobaria pulmonaria (5183) cyanobiont' TaxID=1618022 RepID=UPI000D0C3455|nr:hypothetical protein [Nostoc sp. 'Lobaria pulmonaria (5183) cyanobiont']AVH72949.1 hypothetical protein NLP_4541 [Nostoc sp. 'Lobaria pulmonaria (5183) cyanobiont']